MTPGEIFDVLVGLVFVTGGTVAMVVRYRIRRGTFKFRRPEEDEAWFRKNDVWFRFLGPFSVLLGISRLFHAL